MLSRSRAIAGTDVRRKCSDQRSRILDGGYYLLARLVQQERYTTLTSGRLSSTWQSTLPGQKSRRCSGVRKAVAHSWQHRVLFVHLTERFPSMQRMQEASQLRSRIFDSDRVHSIILSSIGIARIESKNGRPC